MQCWPRYLYDRKANTPQRKTTSVTRFIHTTRACLAVDNDEDDDCAKGQETPETNRHARE